MASLSLGKFMKLIIYLQENKFEFLIKLELFLG